MATELNKVEGFDPKQYARTIQDANGQESLYLDVQYRKMWFRLCNPTGKIVKKICTFDGNLAVVEARIYLDRNDAPENFVSNAFAQRFVDPNNPEYGIDKRRRRGHSIGRDSSSGQSFGGCRLRSAILHGTRSDTR